MTVATPFTVAYSWTGAPASATLPTDSTTYYIREVEGEMVADDITLDETYAEGSTITADGGTYTFSGWDVENATMTEEEPFVMTISGSWTFVADEEPATTYTVTFNSNGGSAVDAQTVNSGETATEPTAPTKDGYTFAGWTLNDEAYDFSTPVTADITLTATWTEDTEPEEPAPAEPVVPDATAETEFTSATFALTPNTEAAGEVDAETYDAENSMFFNITVTGDDDGLAAFNANENSYVTVTLAFADAANISNYDVMRWDTDGNAWTNNGIEDVQAGATAGTITFRTNHLSDFAVLAHATDVVEPDEGANVYYAIVTPGAGVEDAVADTDVDAVGNSIYDLELGDTFTVSVRSSEELMTYRVNFQYDSKYVALTEIPDGWVADTASDAAGGTMRHFWLGGSTYADSSTIAPKTDLGVFEFTLTNVGGGLIDYPVEIPFGFYDGATGATELQASTATHPLSNEDMDGMDTYVRLVDDCKPVCEVHQYGDNSAIILIYSRDVGNFTLNSEVIFDDDAAVLQDVTNAGYIYYNDKTSTEARTTTDGEHVLMAPATFYGYFDETKGQAPHVYGVVVNTGRLFAASEVADEDAIADVEYWVLQNLEFVRESEVDDADRLTPVEYSVKGIVTKDEITSTTDVRVIDKTAVASVSTIDGGLKDAEGLNVWQTTYNTLLAGTELGLKTPLRCDFVRDSDETTKYVGAAELAVYTEF